MICRFTTASSSSSPFFFFFADSGCVSSMYWTASCVMQRRSRCSPRATVSFAFWICCAKTWLVECSKNSAAGHWNELGNEKNGCEKPLCSHEQIGVQILEEGNVLLRFFVLRHDPLRYQLQQHFKVRQRGLSLIPPPIDYLNDLRAHCGLLKTDTLNHICSPSSQ